MVFHLGGHAAVLRLALLRDVHVAQDFEDVDHGVAHGTAEGRDVGEHAVDAEAHRHFVLGGFQVDVGDAVRAGFVDHFQGPLVALGFHGPGHAIGVLGLLVEAAADETHRHLGPVGFLIFPAELKAQPAAGQVAQMGFGEHALFRFYFLIADIDVTEGRSAKQ